MLGLAAGAVVDIQELLEVALLNVFVEALFCADTKAFPSESISQGSL